MLFVCLVKGRRRFGQTTNLKPKRTQFTTAGRLAEFYESQRIDIAKEDNKMWPIFIHMDQRSRKYFHLPFVYLGRLSQ